LLSGCPFEPNIAKLREAMRNVKNNSNFGLNSMRVPRNLPLAVGKMAAGWRRSASLFSETARCDPEPEREQAGQELQKLSPC
jgi:hypothetical protein